MKHHTTDIATRAQHIADRETKQLYDQYGPAINYLKTWLRTYKEALLQLQPNPDSL